MSYKQTKQPDKAKIKQLKKEIKQKQAELRNGKTILK